ncbi:MAG TPA: hypothetical protein VFD78_01650 [Chitinophagaceae bacterium]|nr:hypothetical protein [Chitinophagaceae bacterium]
MNWLILEEDHYYPFGLKHEGYSGDHEIIGVKPGTNDIELIPVTTDEDDPYKYKYQGQERQDDFGLNWDSFKWRNYDYAIGRFFNIDPLAEDYPYNSTYAFQENKMGLGRELEGLEMISERNQNGKSITLNYNVKPINNTQYPDGTILLNNNDFNNLIQARAEQTESTFSGPTANGETVTANVVFDNNATIMWEYNLMIDIEGTATGMEAFGQMSPGKTTEVGNTQENRTQVNVYSHFGKDGELIITPLGTNEATHTGTHEDAHVGGVEHNNISNNIGNPNGTGTEMTPSQRSDLINLVEQQQKN